MTRRGTFALLSLSHSDTHKAPVLGASLCQFHVWMRAGDPCPLHATRVVNDRLDGVPTKFALCWEHAEYVVKYRRSGKGP